MYIKEGPTECWEVSTQYPKDLSETQARNLHREVAYSCNPHTGVLFNGSVNLDSRILVWVCHDFEEARAVAGIASYMLDSLDSSSNEHPRIGKIETADKAWLRNFNSTSDD